MIACALCGHEPEDPITDCDMEGFHGPMVEICRCCYAGIHDTHQDVNQARVSGVCDERMRIRESVASKVNKLTQQIMEDRRFGSQAARGEFVAELLELVPSEPYADEPGW